MNGERIRQSGILKRPRIMAAFDSDSHEVATSSETLSSFLSSPENLYEILPQDRVENWKVNGDQCSFKIKGLAEISLQLESSSVNEVIYTSTSDKPFAFKLIIKAQGDGPSSLSATFDADVNSFMSMMLQTPLTNFLNSLGVALTKKYAGA